MSIEVTLAGGAAGTPGLNRSDRLGPVSRASAKPNLFCGALALRSAVRPSLPSTDVMNTAETPRTQATDAKSAPQRIPIDVAISPPPPDFDAQLESVRREQILTYFLNTTETSLLKRLLSAQY